MFLFPPPAVLEGKQNNDVPVGKVVIMPVGPLPRSVIVDGSERQVTPGEEIEYPIGIDAPDFARFLAKVGLGYAIFDRGLAAFSELFLPDVILGDGNGALTYIGNPSVPIQPAVIPDPPLHGLMLRREGAFCRVYVQLFKRKADPPPIYEVVVGKIADG